MLLYTLYDHNGNCNAGLLFFFFLSRLTTNHAHFFRVNSGTRGTVYVRWLTDIGRDKTLPARKRSIDSLTYEIRDFYEAAELRSREWAHMHAGLGSLKFNYTRWVENNPLTLASSSSPLSVSPSSSLSLCLPLSLAL